MWEGMQTMKVLLLRHGETEWNKEKRFQGRLDSRLTKRGRKDAMHLAKFLRDRGISAIYTSPLGRTLKTAKIIVKEVHAPLYKRRELMEYDYGIAEGKTKIEVDRINPELFIKREKHKYTFRMPGGESYLDIENRTKPFISDIKKKHGMDIIAIVGHACVSRIMLKQLLGLSRAEAMRIKHPNDIVYLIDVDAKKVSYYSAETMTHGEGFILIGG